MVAKVLERPTLVLNRNWQPVNVATVARALVLFWNESARVVDPADYQLYTWADWSELSPHDDEPFIQAVRLRLRVPEVIVLADVRPAADGRRHASAGGNLQAGPVHLPVLRLPAGQRRVDDRPRHSAVAGWNLDLGELRAGVRRLQQAEGRPDAASRPACGCARSRSGRRGSRSTPATACGSKAGRSSSARRTGTSSWRSNELRRPRGLFPWALHECAPGRAGGLQNRPTGFDSSRSCFADVARQRKAPVL